MRILLPRLLVLTGVAALGGRFRACPVVGDRGSVGDGVSGSVSAGASDRARASVSVRVSLVGRDYGIA